MPFSWSAWTGQCLLLFSFEEMELLSVGSLLDLMVGDKIDGVPGAQKDGRGIFMQSFDLVYGNPPVVM